MRMRPQCFDGAPRVAVHAGPRAVDDGDWHPLLELVQPFQHGPLGPAVRNGHVLESRFPAVTVKKNNYPSSREHSTA